MLASNDINILRALLYKPEQVLHTTVTQLIKFIFVAVATALFLFMADYKNNEEKIVKLLVLHSQCSVNLCI